jgi:hypothetical protein
MDFRKRIERALVPLVAELRDQLKLCPTLWVFNYYLARSHAARLYKNEMPDGYWVKWRYLWAILLALPWRASDNAGSKEPDYAEIDRLIEEIFDVYRVGAIYDPGVTPGSEPEFLARLGLAIKVREPEVLAFPEQIKDWALTRFEPFDDSYFLPTFGVRFRQITAWIDGLIEEVSSRSALAIDEGAQVRRDLERLRDRFVENPLEIKAIRLEGREIKLEERMMANEDHFEGVHVFSPDELQTSLPPGPTELIDLLAISPGTISPDLTYPHEENPLEFKTLIALPDNTFYFLDPANAYRIMAKIFERQILSSDALRDRYLKKRDKLTETFVANKLRSIFPKAAIYQNYYVEKGSREKDILVAQDDTVILVECKNSRVRGFAGGGDDLVKYDSDFEKSVQYAYGQALEVKQLLRANAETVFYDEKKREWFKLFGVQIKRIFIVCITITPRGAFGTDLSYQLEKPATEPFPASINLFDFDTITKHLNTPERFTGYLSARESLHGKAHTGDELNYAGYFLKYGNLNIADNVFLDDTFATIFDRKWYAEKGIAVEEPTNDLIVTSVERKGNKVMFESSGSRSEVLIPPAVFDHIARTRGIAMKGSDRNKPCPCGSGRKFKICCGSS